MKTSVVKMKKMLVGGVISCAMISGILFAAGSNVQSEKSMKGCGDSTKTHHMHSTHMKGMEHKEDNIVRKGEIDLAAIDKNKDGKVFQDQMDWNVISDKPGKCPVCKMTLEEVTLKKAKENLQKNGYKVKK